MDAAVAGVIVGVGPKPAVRVDRIVERLRAVADIVTEADHVEGAVLLGHRSVAAACLRRADRAHADDHPLIRLHRRIGQRARPADIGARGGRRIAVLDRLILLVERDYEGVARARDRLQEGELLAEPAMVGIFLDLREAFGIAAPAVRQRRRCRDIVGIAAQKGRAAFRDRLDRRAVDHRMRGMPPGMGDGGGEQQGGGQGEAAHGGSFQGSRGSRGSTRSDARDGRNTSSVGETRRTTVPGW
ncbi:hypothetical protein CA233_10880 [Sphingomonas sp. ABOLD]|nr:hypothetical protein CA233_10880 [Sphingomonas sp. ABOLD]